MNMDTIDRIHQYLENKINTSLNIVVSAILDNFPFKPIYMVYSYNSDNDVIHHEISDLIANVEVRLFQEDVAGFLNEIYLGYILLDNASEFYLSRNILDKSISSASLYIRDDPSTLSIVMPTSSAIVTALNSPVDVILRPLYATYIHGEPHYFLIPIYVARDGENNIFMTQGIKPYVSNFSYEEDDTGQRLIQSLSDKIAFGGIKDAESFISRLRRITV